MQDVVDSFAGGAHRRRIAQVGLPEIDLALKAGKVCRLSGEVVVYPRTCSPRFARARAKDDPMKPAMPVIRSFAMPSFPKAVPTPNDCRSSAQLPHGLRERGLPETNLENSIPV